MKRTIFVVMAVLAVFAIVSCDNGTTTKPTPETYSVTFVAAGGTPTPTRLTGIAKDATITQPAAMTKTGYDFGGWFKEEGLVNQWNFATDKVTDDVVLFAKWTLTPGQEPPPEIDYARAEEVTLGNAFYLIYQFKLPAGKTGADFEKAQASYMLLDEDLATATARNGRLMGNYVWDDFTLCTGTGNAEGQNLAIATYASGAGNKNNAYILDTGKLGNDTNAGSLATKLASEYGITAVGGEWFSLSYDLTGGSKLGDYLVANLPSNFTGDTLFLGVGLPGSGASDYNHFFIRDIKILGYDEGVEVAGIPLYFVKDGVKYAAYSGYTTVDGSNGYGGASRELLDGSVPVAVDLTAVDVSSKDIVITFNYNFGAYEDEPEPAPLKTPAKSYAPLGADVFPPIVIRADTYGLASWNTKPDGSGIKITSASKLTASTVLYAQWAGQIDITLNLNYTGAPAPTVVTIGFGNSLDDALVSPTRDGFTFINWYTNANFAAAGATVVKANTLLEETQTIYARWVEKAAEDFEAPLVVTLNGANNGMAVLTEGKTITITDAYILNSAGTALTRQSGVDSIRFGITLPADKNLFAYEKVVIDYTLTFASSVASAAYPETVDMGGGNGVVNAQVGNQYKTQIFYGKDTTAAANNINYFDLNGTNDPVLSWNTISIPEGTDGFSIKCNPYGFGSGKSMPGVITITINSVTLVAYATE
ncbi:hypothetical protein R84B8_03185 [Treponema sp. R8-4-B8]